MILICNNIEPNKTMQSKNNKETYRVKTVPQQADKKEPKPYKDWTIDKS